MLVVEKLSHELFGQGKGEKATHYTYYVETLIDGRRIYIKRPAWLHNGFDFVVCVENTNFNKEGKYRNNPSHEDIFNDLYFKKEENENNYMKLFKLIEDTHKCNEISFENASKIKFSSGYSCDLIIGVLKWLFIEQDIRYWNYSGRDMLMNGLKEI
jgi:hypothetical protein